MEAVSNRKNMAIAVVVALLLAGVGLGVAKSATAAEGECVPGALVAVPVVAMNVGGPAVSAGGKEWTADANGTGGHVWTSTSTAEVANTDFDAVYRSERAAKNLTYNIPVDNGTYVVRLHVAEMYWGAPGGGPASRKRVETFNIEGGFPEARGISPAQDAKGPMKALVLSYEATVTDGKLTVQGFGHTDFAALQGIEVSRLAQCAENGTVAQPTVMPQQPSAPAATEPDAGTEAEPTAVTTTEAVPTAEAEPTVSVEPTEQPEQPAPVPQQVDGEAMLSANFDNLPTGKLSPSGFASALGYTPGADALEDTSIVDGGAGHGKVIRTFLEAGTIRDDGPSNNGTAFTFALPRTVDSACLSYDIRFSDGFDWSRGGKILGLSGVAPGVSPSLPYGGNEVGDKGWSGRAVWRGPNSANSGGDNSIVSYIYYPSQPNQYGDQLLWKNKSFTAGKWHSIRQCYSMNTVGQSNGKVQAWLDGQPAYDASMELRTRDDVHISGMAWSIFRGGAEADWAGRTDGTIDIDNVRVSAN